MLSHLYYDRDWSPVSDGAFDRLAGEVADIWGLLRPERRFLLGSPDALRASGMGVRITRRCVAGAEHLAASCGADLRPYVFQPTGQTKRGLEYAAIRG